MISHFGSGTPGSGKLVTVDRKVSGFTKVVNEGPADVVVTSGKSFSLQVSIDGNLEQHLKTEVKGDSLVIKTDKSINPTSCKITITMPSISEFRIEGAGDATIKAVSGSSFEGAIEGAGSLTVSGEAKSAKLSIEGAGDIRAYDLRAESVIASVDGAGTVEVQATKDLTASIDGAGDIRYRGNPSTVKSKVDGAGSVKKG